jgi:hypothetical protein
VLDHPVASWLFALENLAICAGYVFVAFVVAPLFMRKVGVRYRTTRVGGIGFFLLCGLTHGDMAFEALFATAHEPMAAQWWMHAIHGPQAVAVWAFVIGLYLELTDVDWTPRTGGDRIPAPRQPAD